MSDTSSNAGIAGSMLPAFNQGGAASTVIWLNVQNLQYCLTFS